MVVSDWEYIMAAKGNFRTGGWLGFNCFDPQVTFSEVANSRNQLRKQTMESDLGYVLPPFLKRWMVSFNGLIKCYICPVRLFSNSVPWMFCSSNSFKLMECIVLHICWRRIYNNPVLSLIWYLFISVSYGLSCNVLFIWT
jgi:hypothetical protein